MPPAIISSRTRGLYEQPPEGEFVLNEASDQALGLVAWWPLSGVGSKGRALDYARKQKFPVPLTGTNGRGSTRDGGTGFVNSGSTSNYLQLVATPPVTAVPYALNAWILPRTSAEYGAESCLINLNGSAGTNYAALIYDGANGEGRGTHVAFLDRSGSNSATWASSTTLAAAGTPAMITGVVSSVTNGSVYLNAGGKQTDSISSRTPTSWDRVTVGAYRDTATFSALNGLMWWAAIWNIALTDQQVFRLYDPKSRYELAYVLGRRTISLNSSGGSVTTTGAGYVQALTAARGVGASTKAAPARAVALTAARAPAATTDAAPARTVSLAVPRGTGAITDSGTGRTVDLTAARAVGTVMKASPGRVVTLSIPNAVLTAIKATTGNTRAISIVRALAAVQDAATGRTVTLSIPRGQGVVTKSSPGAIVDLTEAFAAGGKLLPGIGRGVTLSVVRGPAGVTCSATGRAVALTVARAVATEIAASTGRLVCLTVARATGGTNIAVVPAPGAAVTLSLVRAVGESIVPYQWTRVLTGVEAMRARAAYRLEVFDNEDFEIFGTIRTLDTLAGASLRFVGWDWNGDLAWDSGASPPTATANVTDATNRTYDATTTPKAAKPDGTNGVYRWQLQITNPGQVCDPVWGYLIVTQRDAAIPQALQDQLTGAT